jgi:ankyrin repeat protein
MVKNSGFVYSREDINTCDSSGNCALYYVTKNLDYDFIDFLLQQNADVNVHCAEGNTPLHLIFKSNNEEYIVKFMESGGDLNSLNDAHQTPLAFASMSVLERLGLIKGIALGLSRSASGQSFDNNLLYMQHTRTNAIGNGLAVDPSMEGVASDKAPLEFTYDYIRTQDEGVRGQ